jgi:P4 family phage/plasmid primase-like protien
MQVEVSESQESCLSTALSYIEAGINVTVISSPKCGKRDAGKQPTLVNWQNRRLTPSEFTAEFNSKKNQNVGVITGASSGIVCIDLDGASGQAWFFEHEQQLGAFILERRGNNLHLYFRHPGPDIYVPSRIRLFPGVDVLADGGKQVVTWPSIHRSGDQYKIDNGLTLIDVKYEADILPQWIINELAAFENLKKSRESDDGGVLSYDDSEANVQRCIDVLKGHEEAIQGKGGDNQTYRAAAICADFGLSKKMALKVLIENYNPRCIPPWSTEELKTKILNAYKHCQNKPGNNALNALFPDMPTEEEIEAAIEETPPPLPLYQPKHPVICAQTFIARNPRMTIASSGQFYSYIPRERRWKYMTDEAMAGVVLADIEASDNNLHKLVNASQLLGMTKMLKLVIQGTNPDRELKPDSWFTGRTGEFISCSNGILEISTGHLYPHSSDWFSFTCLPFPYTPEADCPTFKWFLDSIWGKDEEQKEALRRWIGYLLIADMSQQKFAVFKGKSRAGKGTIVRVIESLIGHNNYAACAMHSFGNEFGLESVLGKRAAIFNDAEKAHGDKCHIATERIKTITGNDSIPINRKGMPMLTQTLPCKIMFVCNGMPNFINDENSMTNRMIGFDFQESFIGREDTKLGEKLQGEIPGILNWALEGSRAIMAGEKLIQSEAGKRMVEDIDISNDAVKCFIRDCVAFVNDPYAKAPFNDIWAYFKEWCQGAQFRTGTKESFSKRLKSSIGTRAESYHHGMGRGYSGMVLNKDGAFDTVTLQDLSDPPF